MGALVGRGSAGAPLSCYDFAGRQRKDIVFRYESGECCNESEERGRFLGLSVAEMLIFSTFVTKAGL